MFELQDILSVLLLLSALLMTAGKRFRAYLRAFRLQSLLIAGMVGIMGVREFRDSGRIDVLIVCLLILVLKVFWIPRLLTRTYSDVGDRTEKDFIWNIPVLVLAGAALAGFAHFALQGLSGLPEGTGVRIANAVSLVLIGVFFMISRKKAIGQIIGFLVVENGLFTTAVAATRGMPLIVDLGIFVDLVTAVLIMGVMVFRISERFDSINIDRLNKLKG
ncbi:MAG: hydrogenase [Clostridia bacterium]|nr:hydrogenase [Clostridia bacterium]